MPRFFIRLNRSSIYRLTDNFRFEVRELEYPRDPEGRTLRLLTPYDPSNKESVESFVRDVLTDPLIATGREAEDAGDAETSLLCRRFILFLFLVPLFPGSGIARNTPFRYRRLLNTGVGDVQPEGDIFREGYGWITNLQANPAEAIVGLIPEVAETDRVLFHRALFLKQPAEADEYPPFRERVLAEVEDFLEQTKAPVQCPVLGEHYRRSPRLVMALAREALDCYWRYLDQVFRLLLAASDSYIRPRLTYREKRLFLLLYTQTALCPCPLGWAENLVWDFLGETGMEEDVWGSLLFKSQTRRHPPEKIRSTWKAYLSLYPIYAELQREALRNAKRRKRRRAGAGRFVSLDDPLPGRDGLRLGDLLADKDAVADYDRLEQSIDLTLERDEAEVFRALYLNNETQEAVAARLGLHQSTVSRRLGRAVRKIKGSLR